MSKSGNGDKRSFKSGGVLIAIGGIMYKIIEPHIQEFIENIVDIIAEQIHDSKDGMISIPKLYQPGFPLDVDMVVSLLEQQGFKTATSQLQMKDANAKYKDCIDNQVVGTNPRQGKKVKIGSIICVRYITKEVIEESKKIFCDAEQAKTELKESKAAEKQKRREHTKEKMTDAIDTANCKIKKMFKRNHKQDIEKLKGETLDE